jgi:hypothetical protein
MSLLLLISLVLFKGCRTSSIFKTEITNNQIPHQSEYFIGGGQIPAFAKQHRKLALCSSSKAV